MGNHADPLDQAGEIAQMHNDNGVKNVQRKLAPEQVQNSDGTWPVEECVDCGIDIPEQRLAWGRVRCVDCQGQLERRKSGFR